MQEQTISDKNNLQSVPVLQSDEGKSYLYGNVVGILEVKLKFETVGVDVCHVPCEVEHRGVVEGPRNYCHVDEAVIHHSQI